MWLGGAVESIVINDRKIQSWIAAEMAIIASQVSPAAGVMPARSSTPHYTDKPRYRTAYNKLLLASICWITNVYASAYVDVDNIDLYSFSPQPKLDWMIISPLESNHCSCVQPISVLHCTALPLPLTVPLIAQCFCSCHMQPSSGGWAAEQVLVAAGMSQHQHLIGTLCPPPSLIRRTLSWLMDEGGITSHHANRGQARAVTSDKVQLSDWSWIEWNLPPDTDPACTPHKLHYWTDAIRCMEAERGEKDGGFCCVKLQTARISEAGIILLPAVMCCSIYPAQARCNLR